MMFFGVLRAGEAGHYMHSRVVGEKPRYDSTPWGKWIDCGDHRYPAGSPRRRGGLCRSTDERQGHAVVRYRDGWSALSVHDYTGDHRGNSHLTFLVEGTFTADEMIAMAAEHWPRTTERIGQIVIDEVDDASS